MITYYFEALNFNGICKTIAFTLCPSIGQTDSIEPACYSRNIQIAGTLIFQPSTFIIDFGAIVMTLIMIYHVRSKYTAVGRQEIIIFFYMYLLTTLLDMLLVTGIIPISSVVYPWFAAIHVGCTCATFWCLLLNGFVGFQFAEDGTPMSIWSIRISTLVWFLLTFFLAIGTFKGIAGLGYKNQAALWIFFVVLNWLMFFIYIVSQIILVINTLDDRWPLGDILFACFFYGSGQVLMYVFSVAICDSTKHYIDGLMLGSICNLLTVMMIYKYWDSITKEDLEFAVGSKQSIWESKDMFGEDELPQSYEQSTVTTTTPPQQDRSDGQESP